ncbi:S8 family peptidase [Phytomonospora endophytica]|uniref:Subtilisin family serine protease n=1 Tax=Phytomonospora endophytica TaxID=714109 RepID=A0A841FSH8_9ACTN|nr:S8/S53 family peptidase [Phytomonospora endophytica]MBB6039225.1 subtilisin family serine protease [Phytomonospora endophytica]
MLAPGEDTPGSTIYRYDRVMLCHKLLGSGERLAELDAAIALHGVRVERDDHNGDRVPRRFQRARLTIGDRATPVSIDAWKTVQNLRASVHGGRCDADLAGRVRLEHILVGSAIGGPGSLIGQGNDFWPKGSGPYEGPSYPGRVPVDLMLPMPARRPAEALPGGRRPVIAILDTGIAVDHPDLDISEEQEGDDTFVTINSDLQKVLTANADAETPVLKGAWDQPHVDGSLLGDLASHFGHGTFMTGVVRQLAPDAQVRSYRVMHNDGLTYENELLIALDHIADEAERAWNGDDTVNPVDIVVLAMGYPDEHPEDSPKGGLAGMVNRLANLGIAVVAAAGNYATTRPFYPAAMAAVDREPTAAPVLSVGALNPNGSVAMFSNDGPWVTCFALGASMVSTFPVIEGSMNPDSQNRARRRLRESFDPDDFSSGYAMWSGTSFAAPVIAAKLAAALTTEDVMAGVSVTDARSSAYRLQAAVKAIGG